MSCHVLQLPSFWVNNANSGWTKFRTLVHINVTTKLLLILALMNRAIPGKQRKPIRRKELIRKAQVTLDWQITTFNSWFQTFAVFWMLYAFFWVIPRRGNFIRRFATLCLFHLHRQVGILHNYLPMKMRKSDPKRRNIKFRCRGITQKKAYNYFEVRHHRYVIKLTGSM